MYSVLFAAWIGIASLGITPTQSYDYGTRPDCQIMVTCGPGLPFTEFTYDVADLPVIDSVTRQSFSVSAWTGALTLDPVNQLTYTTNTGFAWTPSQLGHFLFLRTLDGRYFAAIEDLPYGLSDLDFNDALYQLHLGAGQPVPEPASLSLLGLGLAGIALRTRRRSRTI